MEQLITDIDIFGRENTDGSPIEHIEEDAIKNALTLWLTSKKGDFVNNPALGGILDSLVFKNMSYEKLELARFRIKNAINTEFVPSIDLRDISFEPDNENRILRIGITYSSPRTNTEQIVTVYIKGTQETSYKYEEVDYTGETLRNFCMIKKDSMKDKKLLFDTDKGTWKYGKYLFINLTTADPYFDEILKIANL